MLQTDLETRESRAPDYMEGDVFQLNIANAVWGQENYPFLDDYVDLLDTYYGAGLQQVDFINATEAARLAINAWVEDQTEDRIQDIIPPGLLDTLTRLVLANAVYFNASWHDPFNASDTHDDTFTLLDGSQVTVPMMSQSEVFRYGRGEDYQAVQLPYFGGNMNMLIVLPDAGKFEAVETALDARVIDTVYEIPDGPLVHLFMPRFEYEYAVSLSTILRAMGMTDAFDPAQADFSGMAATDELFISEVLHKSFIKVDEKGTEAAAATIVMMAGGGGYAPSETVELRLDRPFIYLIYDWQTGTILFVGRVLNPAA
jgi:serpin B